MASSRRSVRPLLYALLPTAIGGGVLFVSYRPRNIPGSDPAAVPPPNVTSNGAFRLPDFPRVKSRDEQISCLKYSVCDNDVGSRVGFWTAILALVCPRYGPGNSREQLHVEHEPFDLLIIGGGATGSGIALDAASRGLKVALVERDDFSSGTSSKSTKLVHGGVRYLEKAVWEMDYSQYKLVKEALRERRYFLDIAPHLSMWLPIMIPLDSWWKAPYFWIGTKFYDFLAGSENIESSYFLTRSKALDAFPMLKKEGLKGALVYYDGSHNDSRMNVSIAMTAALYGATVVNHMEVTSLTKDQNGRLTGAILKDKICEANGRFNQFNVRAKGIINATGPFTDSIRKMDDPNTEDIVAPSSGVHIILPGYYSPSDMGLIDPSTSDGRVIFFLPWQGNTIAGTTDSPTKIRQNPPAGEEEIDWILSEIRGYIQPDIKVRRGDVLAAWSGIRPLVRDPGAKRTEGLVRSHLITTSDSGLLTCAGGKWTTYREMAEQTVDEAICEFKLDTRPIASPRISGSDVIPDSINCDGSCRTHRLRLLGAHGFSKTLFINLIQHFGLETDVARHLACAYGDRAWTVGELCSKTLVEGHCRGSRISPFYPFVDGEVRYAVRHEYAQTVVDVLARRTRLAFLNAQAAFDALPRVISLMAEELDWDKRRREREWMESVEFLQSMGLGKRLDDVLST